MPSSRPSQSLSFRGPNPVRSGGDPMWIGAGKPMLRLCDPPAIALVSAGVSRDNSACKEAAIHPEESDIATAVATVPASASSTDRWAHSVGMHWPSRPCSPMIPNLFPTQRSRYAVA